MAAPKTLSSPGTFIISLDFELMWGMFDKVTNATYGDNLDGVHEVVPKLLDLFTTHNIHATWATVGLLAESTSNALDKAVNSVTVKPEYINASLSAYYHIATHDLDDYPEHYFAPHLIEQIIATPHQELASHTYSHFYCLEAQSGGVDDIAASFDADCAAMVELSKRLTTPLSSIVFPRNQISEAALTIAAAHGITAFRGTEHHFIYQARDESAKTNLLLRGLRFADRYLNITGHHTYAITSGAMTNLPASRQLHPYNKKLHFLEPLKLRRIKNGMTHAAKRGEVFHLWWHPHNFGVNQVENIRLLAELLAHFRALEEQYGMQSKTMREAATLPDAPTSPTTSVAAD